jgi:hypothetical protein
MPAFASLALGLVLLGLVLPAAGNSVIGAPGAHAALDQTPLADPRVGSIARLLAGLPPSLPAHREIAESGEWREHRDSLQAGWGKLRHGRGGAMASWRAESIGNACSGSGTLLYPFSGPDFTNAYLLFPGCRKYIFFGLELPGSVPELEALDRQARARLLGDVRLAVGDLIERNYFITSRMTRQLHTSQLRGVVPVLIASMALMGLDVRSVEPFELPATRPEDEADVAQTRSLRKLRALRIVFQRPGEPAQQLQYFSVDATNQGLAPYPEFLLHLRSAKPAPMLMKSASYLLQDKQFRLVRDALLETAQFLVQDDTGMPYEVLKSAGWDVQLYGAYRKPIKPFHWAYQPQLEAAYKSGQAGELPFAFSYHWRGGKSNAMVARRVAVQAAAPAGASSPAAR